MTKNTTFNCTHRKYSRTWKSLRRTKSETNSGLSGKCINQEYQCPASAFNMNKNMKILSNNDWKSSMKNY